MARWTQTWLSGTGVESERGEWPGEKLGLPAEGVGAVAGGGQRFLAFVLDLIAAAAITSLFIRPEFGSVATMQQFNWASVGVWAALTVSSAALLSLTPGMGLVGIRVARLDGVSMVGPIRALVRCVLTAVLIPPLVRDHDGRGVHDRLTGTVVLRLR